MAEQHNFIFEGSTSQWARLGHAEHRLLESTGLTVIIHVQHFNRTTVLSIYEPRQFGGECLIEKSFSRWSIDSASDWLAKLTNDYASWK